MKKATSITSIMMIRVDFDHAILAVDGAARASDIYIDFDLVFEGFLRRILIQCDFLLCTNTYE